MAGMEVDDGPTKAGSKRNFSRSGLTGRWAGQEPQVCRFWLEGRCLKGDKCQWLHPDGAGTTGRPHSSNGGINKRPNNVNENRGGFSDGGSGFQSGGGARRNVTSARWGRPRGANNNFNNSSKSGRSGADGARRPRDKVCSFWLKGNCRKGDDCDFLHAHTASPDISLIKQLAGHDKAVRAIELPQGSAKLYTGGQDETVRVWDCNTGECISVVPMGGDVGALLSAANFLFIGLPNEVKIWDLQNDTMQSKTFSSHGQIHALAVNADMLFAGTQDGSILAWKFTSSTGFELAASLVGHMGPVITLASMGGRLYSGSMDKCIKVWDLGTGACLQTLEGHTNVVMQLLFWDKFLLSCSLDGTVKVWAPTPEGFFEDKYTHPEDSDGHANTRNGALTMCGTMDSTGKPVLLCSYNDNTVRFYDLPTFLERGTIQTREEVRAMRVGPEGLIFSGEGYGEIKVWRFATAGNT